MKYDRRRVQYSDGVLIDVTYKKTGIVISSLDEITEFHLPYLAMQFISKSYELDNREQSWLASTMERYILKLIQQRINTHSPETDVNISFGKQLEQGELEKKLGNNKKKNGK